MYNAYNGIRSFLFRLVDAKFGTENQRMRYFSSFVSGYDFDALLDVGCGKGLLFKNVENGEKHRLFVGVDLMKERQKGYQHVAADVTRLPFKDKLFSLITAFSLIEHIPEADRASFYDEIRRMAKDKSAFVIQLPNRYFVIESHTFLPFFGFLPSCMHSFAYRGGYVAVPSLKKVIASLGRHGFETCKVERYEAPFLPFGRLLGLFGFYRLFPMGYIIHARARNQRGLVDVGLTRPSMQCSGAHASQIILCVDPFDSAKSAQAGSGRCS
jgi:SAM-dependent methyltransferase